MKEPLPAPTPQDRLYTFDSKMMPDPGNEVAKAVEGALDGEQHYFEVKILLSLKMVKMRPL